eukprot:6938898-Prymnesium_polylepis.3
MGAAARSALTVDEQQPARTKEGDALRALLGVGDHHARGRAKVEGAERAAAVAARQALVVRRAEQRTQRRVVALRPRARRREATHGRRAQPRGHQPQQQLPARQPVDHDERLAPPPARGAVRLDIPRHLGGVPERAAALSARARRHWPEGDLQKPTLLAVHDARHVLAARIREDLRDRTLLGDARERVHLELRERYAAVQCRRLLSVCLLLVLDTVATRDPCAPVVRVEGVGRVRARRRKVAQRDGAQHALGHAGGHAGGEEAREDCERCVHVVRDEALVVERRRATLDDGLEARRLLRLVAQRRAREADDN